MKRSIKYFMILLIMFITMSLAPVKTSHAASAEIKITSEATEYTVGESVLVTILITSDTAFGDFEANLTYDDEVLEYQGTHSYITGSNGFLRIKDMNVIEEEYNRKYALEFKAINVGTSEIAFNNPIMVYDFETGIEMAVSSNDLTVDVKAAETASTNANLSSLKISPSEINPPFDKSVFRYNTIVNHNTDQLVIDASSEDESAVVKISGNESLKEGENKIIVTVIAESGNVIEYIIDVFKEAAPDEETPDEINPTPSTKHGSFQVVTIKDELFAVYNGKYKLVEPGPEVELPKGYIKTRIIISDTSIVVYAPENNLEYDYLLIYAENEMGEAGFYQYDRIERTLQRYSNENPLKNVGKDNNSEPNTDRDNVYQANLRTAIIVITLLSIFSALMIVVSIRLYMNANSSKKSRRRK